MFEILHPDLAPYRRLFSVLVQQPDEKIDLAEAALLIAAEEQPGMDLDPRPWLRRLDDMAAALAPRLAGVRDDLQRVHLLGEFLTREVGLRGNADDYYDPRNSFLNEVMERGLGIPITLAIVWMEVGRRAGIPLVGVSFPGHFLLRHARHPQIFLDPFDGGRLLTLDDCRELLRQVSGDSIPFDPKLLRPTGSRQMLLRMLANLRGIYRQQGQLRRLLSVLNRILLIDPGDLDTLRDRGLLRLQAGDLTGGVEDLEHYLEAAPYVPEEDELASLVAEVRGRLDRVH